MKKIILLTLTMIGCFKANALTKNHNDYIQYAKDGDLIFQTDVGTVQGHAIQLATLSKYNHVGVVSVEKSGVYVYEAIGRVTKTKIEDFTSRKTSLGRFVVYRHKDANKKSGEKVVRNARKFLGKKYDPYLRWSNDRMYCSELAYKAINTSGLSLNDPKKISDMKIAMSVANNIDTQYTNIDTSQLVVSPGDLARDSNMSRIFKNY